MKPEELVRFLTTLGETPDRILQLTQGLDHQALTWKPSSKDFSILENVTIKGLRDPGFQYLNCGIHFLFKLFSFTERENQEHRHIRVLKIVYICII